MQIFWNFVQSGLCKNSYKLYKYTQAILNVYETFILFILIN